MVVHKQEMLQALDKGTADPCWRTAYGAVRGLVGDQMTDAKIMRNSLPAPAGLFVSTSDQAYRTGRVGRVVRDRFPDKSPYEK